MMVRYEPVVADKVVRTGRMRWSVVGCELSGQTLLVLLNEADVGSEKREQERKINRYGQEEPHCKQTDLTVLIITPDCIAFNHMRPNSSEEFRCPSVLCV
jgi:hypothetical protein